VKKPNWQVILGLSLVILSAIVYVVHFLIFRDFHHIMIYLVGDIAFVPVEVLLVTLIIHRLLSHREKRVMMEKLNMVIGAFFSEVGTKLLSNFSDYDPEAEKIEKELILTVDWSDKKFLTAANRLKSYPYRTAPGREELETLKKFLTDKMGSLLRMLENPNLLEHDSFTDMLWAVFHLAEELANRQDFQELPDSDVQHLLGDVKRAYGRLVSEWLDYMHHLERNYPYLFSLAIRTNPFNPSASPIVS
jgi:hypothetical protein